MGGKVLKVIADVKAMSPEFKSNLATLVDDAKAIAVPLAPVLASGGENVAADLAALMPVTEDVMKLVKDFIAFLPSVEAALKKVDADMRTREARVQHGALAVVEATAASCTRRAWHRCLIRSAR